MFHNPLLNKRGMGLIMAIFIIVVVAMFGLLIARYTTISSVASAEDYIWAQALYSAESTMRLNLLRNDRGGKLPAQPTLVKPIVGGVETAILTDSFAAQPPPPLTTPATIRVQAIHDTKVSRTVEAKYMLSK